MRIIAGRHRGRALKAPGGDAVRPTADRVRESVFNVLAHGLDWEGLDGASVLDVFAGSGAAGLEALSRGAAHAVFIDVSGESLRTIRANAAELGEVERCTFLRLDATRLVTPPRAVPAPFRLAFLDAPYAQGLTGPALAALAGRGWVAPGSIVVAEVGAREPLSPPPAYIRVDERSWGAARVVFLTVRGAAGAARPLTAA